ncbi:unnamed protein product [Fusarium graminearum]|nr:unnamed protein product [Fusarium graminearum]VTO88502.1 unnamed protein product [Fusarium graminearum]
MSFVRGAPSKAADITKQLICNWAFGPYLSPETLTFPAGLSRPSQCLGRFASMTRTATPLLDPIAPQLRCSYVGRAPYTPKQSYMYMYCAVGAEAGVGGRINGSRYPGSGGLNTLIYPTHLPNPLPIPTHFLF